MYLKDSKTVVIKIGSSLIINESKSMSKGKHESKSGDGSKVGTWVK